MLVEANARTLAGWLWFNLLFSTEKY